jgi:hypothetical protein
MGSPVSGLVAKIYLQHFEDMMKHSVENGEITYYNRYVDDIVIIFDCKEPMKTIFART